MSLRISYAAIVAFIAAILGATVPICFAVLGVVEIILLCLLVFKVSRSLEYDAISFYGFLSYQYAGSNDLNIFDALNIGSLRILAATVGFLSGGSIIIITIAFILFILSSLYMNTSKTLE